MIILFFAGVPSSPEFLEVKTPVKFYSKRVTSTSGEILSTASSGSSLLKKHVVVRTPAQILFEGHKKKLSRKHLFQENINDTTKTKQLKRAASGLLQKKHARTAQILRLRKK